MKRLYFLLLLFMVLSGIAIYNQATAGSISGIIPHRHTANYNGGKLEFTNISGTVNPAKISPQGAGSGLNADKVDGYSTSTSGQGGSIPVNMQMNNGWGIPLGYSTNPIVEYQNATNTAIFGLTDAFDFLSEAGTKSIIGANLTHGYDGYVGREKYNQSISAPAAKLVVNNTGQMELYKAPAGVGWSPVWTKTFSVDPTGNTVASGTGVFANISSSGYAKIAGKLHPQYLSPQGSGSGLNADTVDSLDSATLLSRANHTGTQSPATISPQGPGSGLNADTVDSLDSATLLSRANHTGTQSPATISPQGPGSGLNADTVDSLDSATLLSRANHTGTQSPATISPQGAGSGLDADTVDNFHAGGFQKLRGSACQTFLNVPAGTSQTGTEQAFTTYNTDIFTTNVFSYNGNLNVSICTTFLTNTGDYVVMTDGNGGALPTCALPTLYNRAVAVVRNNDTASQSIRYCLYASYY